MLFNADILSVGVKIPVQVMLLSVLVMVASDTLSAVMLAALEKLVTTSEKTNVNVALSPGLSAGKSILSELVKVVLSVTEKVKELTAGRLVSTLKFEVVTEVPGFPTWSYQLAASVIVLLSTSVSSVGAKIPLQADLLSER